MKKVLCLLISLMLVLTSGVLAYADNNDGNEGVSDNKAVEKKNVKAQKGKDVNLDEDGTGTSLEALRMQFKEHHRNKEARKAILKKIVQLKRQNKDNSTPVFVNGEEVEMDTPPVIKYGRTLVPVRAVTKALGAQVQWNAETYTVTITKGDIVIEIVLGSNKAKVNGEEVELGVAAEINNSRTYVPIRFIAETFKQKVEWDGDTGSVIIEEDKPEEDGANGNEANENETSEDESSSEPAADTGGETSTSTEPVPETVSQ